MAEPTERLPEDIARASRELAIELCAISSESGNTAGLERVAGHLAGSLSRCGLVTELLRERDRAGVLQPVLAARGPAGGGAPLLLVGHLDTVLPAAEPRLEGDRLVATGALDMKGGLAMLAGALQLLAARGRELPGGLLLVAVPDEEVEGTISERVTRRYSEGARAVLVLEPGLAREGRETLVAGRRGLTEWQLEVTGRAAHSGLAYWEGRSALAAASDFCLSARRLSLPGSGRTVNPARLVAGTADFVDDLAGSHGLLGTSRQRNVVADRAVAEGEVRYLAPDEGAVALGELRALAVRVGEEHGVTALFAEGTSLPPVDPRGPGKPLAKRAVALAGDRGFVLEIEDDRGGVSFPNYLTDPSRVPVVDGLGPVGDGMHTRSEWLDLRSLERRIVLLADLLETL